MGTLKSIIGGVWSESILGKILSIFDSGLIASLQVTYTEADILQSLLSMIPKIPNYMYRELYK